MAISYPPKSLRSARSKERQIWAGLYQYKPYMLPDRAKALRWLDGLALIARDSPPKGRGFDSGWGQTNVCSFRGLEVSK